MSEYDQDELFHANYSLAAFALTKFFGGYDEDLHQEALLALWKAAGRFDRSRGVKFTTFAVKAIRNRIANVLRDGKAAKRDDSGTVSLESELTESLRFKDVIGEEDVREHIDIEGIKRVLTKREWGILVLRLRGYRCREIGRHYGVSAGNISSTLDRIRKKIKPFV